MNSAVIVCIGGAWSLYCPRCWATSCLQILSVSSDVAVVCTCGFPDVVLCVIAAEIGDVLAVVSEVLSACPQPTMALAVSRMVAHHTLTRRCDTRTARSLPLECH